MHEYSISSEKKKEELTYFKSGTTAARQQPVSLFGFPDVVL